MTPPRWARPVARSATRIGLCFFALCLFAPAASAAPGDLDPTFGGGDGMARARVPYPFLHPFDADLAPDGSLVVAGKVTSERDRQSFVTVRFTPDGLRDTSFGGDGRVYTDTGGAYGGYATSVAVQPDGNIVVGGHAVPGSTLIRYLPDGTVDPGFGDRGIVSIDVPFVGNVEAIRFRPDGRIVVLIMDHMYDQGVAVVGLLPDGRLDPSFGDAGVVVTGPCLPLIDAYDMWLQPDGKLLITGSEVGPDAAWTIARLHLGGCLDTSFARDGVVETGGLGVAASVTDLVVLPTGPIVAVGVGAVSGSRTQTLVGRYLAGGALDRSFGDQGFTPVAVPRGLIPLPTGIGVDPTGRILVGGGVYDRHGPDQDVMLARMGAGGLLDPTFGDAGLVIHRSRQLEYVVAALVTEAGAPLIAGMRSRRNGEAPAIFAFRFQV